MHAESGIAVERALPGEIVALTGLKQTGTGDSLCSKEAPIAIANIAHIDPRSGGPTRIGFKTLQDGRKVRFAKKSGEVIDV